MNPNGKGIPKVYRTDPGVVPAAQPENSLKREILEYAWSKIIDKSGITRTRRQKSEYTRPLPNLYRDRDKAPKFAFILSAPRLRESAGSIGMGMKSD